MYDNLIYNYVTKCPCAVVKPINYSNLLNINIINDTQNEACIAKVLSDGTIKYPMICFPEKTQVSLENKIAENEPIKIITKSTIYHDCSGMAKFDKSGTTKISEIEKNKWNIC